MADIARKMQVLLRPNLGTRLWGWGRALGHFIFFFLNRKNMKDHMAAQGALTARARWCWPPAALAPLTAARSGWGSLAFIALISAAYFIVIFIAMPALMPIIVRVLP